MHICTNVIYTLNLYALLWCMGDDGSDLPHQLANVNCHLLHITYPTESYVHDIMFRVHHINYTQIYNIHFIVVLAFWS